MSTPTFSTCDFCDANENDTSGAFRVLPGVFQRLGAPAAMAGAVHTVRAPEDNSQVREAVHSAGEGRILVVDGGGLRRRALLGGNLAAAAARNGWGGVLVDGCVRDAEELRASGLPIWALGLTPMRTQKHGAGAAGVAIQIQGVSVRERDWLYADADGIVVAAHALS